MYLPNVEWVIRSNSDHIVIPRITDNRFTTPNQQNPQTCSLNIYSTISHWTSLHVSARKGSSLGNLTKYCCIKPNYLFLYTADVVHVMKASTVLCWLSLSTSAASKILYIKIHHIYTNIAQRN